MDKVNESYSDAVWEIADRYNTSTPVSGDWSAETEHELMTIADELGVSPEEAKQIMIDELGFAPEDFNENLQESLDDEQCADVLDAITSKVYNGCWSVLEDKFPGSTDCVYEMITKEQFEAAVEKAMLYVEDEYF